MKHEADTLTKVTEMRAQAMSAGPSSPQRVDIENQVTRAIGGIMVAVENYPQLKADANFRQLQASLNEIEEQIAASRRAYNAAATDLNNAVEMLPSSIVASMMGYTRRELFEIPQAQRENVSVQALFNS
jgi:LemA protein